MFERTKKFTVELKGLVAEGDLLSVALQYDCFPESFEDQLMEMYDDDNDKVQQYIKKLPNFKASYQEWYSKAQAVIKQVLPDRLSDFISYYEYSRVRKEIDFQNYMIRDYLQGLSITRRGGHEVVANGSAAIPEFGQ